MNKSDLEEIKEEFDMELFLDRESFAYKTTRGRSGPQLNVRECPFCGDERSRVYVNSETGSGNCFVCGETFNKTKFVNARLGFGGSKWRETFDYMRQVVSEQGWRPKKKAIVSVSYDDVALPESVPLPTANGENLVYLEQRGFSAEICEYFKLRYCESARWVGRRPDGSPDIRMVTERVIIPIFDLDGKLVTFQGRDITGEQDPKYWFPPGLPGTGRYLFNGQNAVRAKRVIAGEGVFDVAAIKLAIDGDVSMRDIVPIGTFGKHLSFGDMDGNDQLGAFLTLKQNGLEEVTVMWDGEPKALEAAVEAAKRLTSIGLVARIALLPKDKDPNEVPAEVVREAIRKSIVYSAKSHIIWMLKNPYR